MVFGNAFGGELSKSVLTQSLVERFGLLPFGGLGGGFLGGRDFGKVAFQRIFQGGALCRSPGDGLPGIRGGG